MKKRINIVIAALLVLLAGCRSAKKETTVISDMQKIEMNYRFSVAIDMPQCDSTFRNNLLLKLAVEMKL